MERVVVTGMGISSPLGCTVPDFWQGLLGGKSGIVYLEGQEFADLPVRIGGLVSGYDFADHFDRKEVRRMSRASQLAIIAAEQAICEAQLLDSQEINPVSVGVVVGSSIGGFSASDPFFRDYYQSGRKSALVIPLSMNNGPASNISIKYAFQGPVLNVDAACASGAHSIGYAYHLIRMGILDVAVVGGADSPFSRAVMEAWCSMRALSLQNDAPATACRPFSADRDGMVLGEGAGIIVLESESSARSRNIVIQAEIKGYGASADSFHLTQPNQSGPVLAIQRALLDAGMAPEKIDYINAHGTATPQNDRNETNAIKTVFGDHAYKIPIIGTKGAMGHSIAASGTMEMISCILSIQTKKIPPTINYTTLDPDCDLDYVTEGSRHLPINNVMSNSFAFGGSNAVLIVGKYEL